MKKTPLNTWHKRQGAKMAEFGGYEMPLWYSSPKNEHLSVLTGVGVFDTSHMATVTVEGQGAFNLLQQCFSRDLERCIGSARRPLIPGRCVYGVFLNEDGGVVDDAIIAQLSEDRYLCVINAGMGGIIAKHLMSYATDLDVSITDLSDQLGKMDIQGPFSAKVLKKILKDPEKVFEKMSYFTLKGAFDGATGPDGPVVLNNGLPILLSRTGYTGEFGFEIFSDPSHLVEIWEMVLNAGGEYGIMPCGLGARDSLRTGAVLPLSHQDIGNWPFIRNPWTFALPWDASQARFSKDFVGAKALLECENGDYTFPFIGHDLRKVSISEETEVLDDTPQPIGTVLTCVSDMGIDRVNGTVYSVASPDKPEGFVPQGLSCGFVKVRKELKTGQTIELRNGHRTIKVNIANDIRPARTARVAIKDML